MQDKYHEVILVLIAGTLGFLVLTGIVVFLLLFYQKKRFLHQQQLLQTQAETQEETFRQISEELHDNVGQLLGTTKNLLFITQRSLEGVPDALTTAIETLTRAMKDLRSLSQALNKEWLAGFKLIDNLRVESERINLSQTVAVTLDATCSDLPLQSEAQIVLFRIIQEALHNGMKHAGSTRIAINIGSEANRIFVLIRDNGKGFDAASPSGNGVGLINMKRRTKTLHGTINWESTPADGTTVKISIPLQT